MYSHGATSFHFVRPGAHGPHEPWHSGRSQRESWQSENLPKPRRELKTLENTTCWWLKSVVFWDFNMNNLRNLEERNRQLSGPRLLSYKCKCVACWYLLLLHQDHLLSLSCWNPYCSSTAATTHGRRVGHSQIIMLPNIKQQSVSPETLDSNWC